MVFARLYNITILISCFTTRYLDSIDADGALLQPILVPSPLMGQGEGDERLRSLFYFCDYFNKFMFTELENTSIFYWNNETRLFFPIEFHSTLFE